MTSDFYLVSNSAENISLGWSGNESDQWRIYDGEEIVLVDPHEIWFRSDLGLPVGITTRWFEGQQGFEGQKYYAIASKGLRINGRPSYQVRIHDADGIYSYQSAIYGETWEKIFNYDFNRDGLVSDLFGTVESVNYALSVYTTDFSAADIAITNSSGTSLSVTELATIGGSTTGAVTVINSVNISGNIEQVKSALVRSDTNVIASTSNVEISILVYQEYTATELSIIGDKTIGAVTFSERIGINGTAAEIIEAVNTLNPNPFLFNSKISGSASGANIITIDSLNGSGFIDGIGLTEITGTASEVIQAINDLDAASLYFTSTLVGSASAANISEVELRNGFFGSINGSGLTEITGTASEIIQAISDLDTDPVNFESTISGSASAANIAVIESFNGSGTINGSGLTEITGTASEIIQAISDLDTDPVNFESTISGSASAANIAAIESFNGSGTINGSGLTEIIGTASEIIQAISDLDTDPVNFESTISGSASAANIAAIESFNGSGTINGSGLTEIIGTASEIFKPS